MLKIGIFGGSFNPPHIGHQRLALQAADRLALNKVIVMPAFAAPHKQTAGLAAAYDRVNMCRLGLCPDSRFEVSTLEIERADKSYTYKTFEQLLKMYHGAEFYLIIGSDMLETFTQWKNWQDILGMARVCAASRQKGHDCNLGAFTPEQAERITVLPVEPFEVSSSEIRSKIVNGESTEGLLEDSVRGYIDKNHLYDALLAPYRELLKQKLSERRLYHSECVARSARELAKKYGADENKAVIAGLLHDIMKNAEEKEQKAVIAKAGIVLSKAEDENVKVLHSIAGEAFLRTQTDINDEEIFSAVRRHTTGSAGMSLLDKVIYVADFISSDRDYPDVGKVIRLAYVSLEEAILYTTSFTIDRLVSKSKFIHPATVECYNDTLTAINRKGK